jgi:hypothetical protein
MFTLSWKMRRKLCGLGLFIVLHEFPTATEGAVELDIVYDL